MERNAYFLGRDRSLLFHRCQRSVLRPDIYIQTDVYIDVLIIRLIFSIWQQPSPCPSPWILSRCCVSSLVFIYPTFSS